MYVGTGEGGHLGPLVFPQRDFDDLLGGAEAPPSFDGSEEQARLGGEVSSEGGAVCTGRAAVVAVVAGRACGREIESDRER